ncbi:MAG: hypothetical protein MJB14_02135 [Spirochaetes bacterium]|nr:hypothetical protein [Spirochaetota bacterium]
MKNIRGLFLEKSLFLFLFSSIIHFILLIYFIVSFSEDLYILFIYELVFFLIFCQLKVNRIYRIIVIAFIFFVLNLFFNEGKIIFEFSWIKITQAGLDAAVEKSFFILILFCFSFNHFFINKNFLLPHTYQFDKNLFILSIHYFFILLDLAFEKKIRSLLIRIIRIYRRRPVYQIEQPQEKINSKYYIYQLLLFLPITLLLFKNVMH